MSVPEKAKLSPPIRSITTLKWLIVITGTLISVAGVLTFIILLSNSKANISTFYGLVFLEIGLLLILGSFLLLVEPWMSRGSAPSEQEVHGVVIKKTAKPKTKPVEGLRKSKEVSNPQQIPFQKSYWAKILLLTCLTLFLSQVVLEFVFGLLLDL